MLEIFSVKRFMMLTVCVVLAGTAATNVCAAEESTKSIEAQALKSLVVYPQYSAPATVVAINESALSAQITAVIESIPVDVGQVVKKGQVLVSLQRKDYQLLVAREQAVLNSLEAKIELARYQLQRAEKLKTQQAVSDELLKQRETELAVLLSEQTAQQQALQQAQLNYARGEIVAPYNAVIVSKLASVGELANPGTPLIKIVDAERREVSAKLQSHQIASLRAAKQLMFSDRVGNYPLTMRSVLPVVSVSDRTQEARLVFKSENALPGASGELSWTSDAPHVPAETLVQREGKLGVFVINKDKASFLVIPGAAEGRPAEVNLPLETQIITKGRFRLQDGDTIKLL